MAGSVYDTRRWKRVRSLQLARHPMCQMCAELGMTVPRPALHVDHKTPIEAGGAPFDPLNLQSLCHEHHSWKTANLDCKGIALED